MAAEPILLIRSEAATVPLYALWFFNTDSFVHCSVMVHIRTYASVHILVQQNRS